MTAARRSPLAASAAVLITLLVVLMPASAAVAMPSAGQLLGKPVSHHLAMPAVLRAESATQDLHADATLVAAALLGLAPAWLGLPSDRSSAGLPNCRVGARQP